jgi:hypothetical protein
MTRHHPRVTGPGRGALFDLILPALAGADVAGAFVGGRVPRAVVLAAALPIGGGYRRRYLCLERGRPLSGAGRCGVAAGRDSARFAWEADRRTGLFRLCGQRVCHRALALNGRCGGWRGK